MNKNKFVDWQKHPEYDRLIIAQIQQGYTNKSEIAKLIPNATYKSIEHRITYLKSIGKIESAPPILREEAEDIIKIYKKDIPNFVAEFGELVTNVVNQQNLKFKEIPLKAVYNKRKQDHTSILNISDVHIGEVNIVFDSKLQKKITTYNHSIYLQELEALKNTVFRLHAIQSHTFNLKTLYINFLGDILTNDRIFEGQVFHLDMAVGEQLWEAVYSMFGFINSMKQVYQKIVVTGVVGNHGRSNPSPKVDEPVQNNFEYHLYKILEYMFKDDKRVEVIVPDTREHIIDINGWKHMLLHGDIFKGKSERALETQIKNLLLNIGEFQAIDFGHFHKIKDTDVGDRILVKLNGSWIEKDNYALKHFKLYSVPKQFFYGCSKKRIETWSYKIDLRLNYA